MTLPSGTRLGPYEVLSPLGAGGMGEVYRARDTRLDREVAVKVLPEELASNVERLRRFEKEAKSASSLNHPNIVTIYDIGSDGGVSYIAMERVEGPTLRTLLAGGALPIKRLLQIAPQIADGLSKAHEVGIVHRDLKPENVMVTKDGLVKILDFGLAKLTSRTSGSDEGSHLPTMTETTPGVVVGTVGYMSPEQASGLALDFRSDQFALGSILYEMATGKRAFQKKTAIDTLAAILNDEPEPIGAVNPQVPAPLRWIVERCLAKEGRGRYESTGDLARDLATVRDHVSEVSLLGTVAERGPRRRIRLVLGGAILAAAVVAAGILVERGLFRPPSSAPRFKQVTFGLQAIIHARFAPGNDSVVYSALVGGAPIELFLASRGAAESRPLGIHGTIASVSPAGEIALLRGDNFNRGTLAIASLGGGAPRDLLENVRCACFGHDGKSLAVVHAVEGSDRLEFPIGKVLLERAASQSPEGQSIRGCEVSRDGARIAFGDTNDLQVVDLTGKVARIAPFVVGMDFQWSPKGDELWYADYETGITEIKALSLDGKTRWLASLPGDFVLRDVSEQGRVLIERATSEQRAIGRLFGDGGEADVAFLEGSNPISIGGGGRGFLFDVGGPGYGSSAVYLKASQGSPPVRLAAGWGMALSPDGKWAVTQRDLGKPPLILMPTGAGAERPLPDGGLKNIGWTNWLPDARGIVFAANASGEKSRLYVQEISGGSPRAISPEGYTVGRGVTFVSPDGRLVVARDEQGRAVLLPTEGGSGMAPRLIAGLSPGEKPVQWSADGKWLYIFSRGGSSTISLLDPVSGQRKPWKTFSAFDPSLELHSFLVTPDGESWIRSYSRYRSNLLFLEGLR